MQPALHATVLTLLGIIAACDLISAVLFIRAGQRGWGLAHAARMAICLLLAAGFHRAIRTIEQRFAVAEAP